MSHRPAIVPAMIAFDVLIAVFGPLASLIGRFTARPVTNAEGTNYASAAFGTVGVALAALVMAPLALALLYIAWATWARASWAWWANVVILAGLALGAFTGFIGGVLFLRLAIVGACVAAGAFWVRTDAREWYGA
jgi:hypothetical protein